MQIIGNQFELFWVSDSDGSGWTLSRALQTHLGLSHVSSYEDVLAAVHPRDQRRVRQQLESARSARDGITLKFKVWLPSNQVFAQARLVGWPRFINGNTFLGHIGFWRIKLPSAPPDIGDLN